MVNQCRDIAKRLVEGGKGLLAADESNTTMGKRLADIGFENTPENRRLFREMLFTTPDIGTYCSGVILFEETLEQHTTEGTPFVKMLEKAGVLAGIKVDLGTTTLPNSSEYTTQGLDGLRIRFANFYQKGARFAKWRGVFTISDATPTEQALYANAEALAHYSALAQEANIVPIVEPEVLMDGNHTQNRCAEVTEAVLTAVFDALARHKVDLEGILLKPNMVISGTDSKANTAEEVAMATVASFQKVVPTKVAGIAFLSGGQGEVEATENLQAINALNVEKPWPLTFSYGRALQKSALEAFGQCGDEQRLNVQKAFAYRARMNWLAANGHYKKEEYN